MIVLNYSAASFCIQSSLCSHYHPNQDFNPLHVLANVHDQTISTHYIGYWLSRPGFFDCIFLVFGFPMPSYREILEVEITRSLFWFDSTAHHLVLGLYAIGSCHLCSTYARRVEATDEPQKKDQDNYCVFDWWIVGHIDWRPWNLTKCCSVCLTGIARTIYVTRLDLGDPTYTIPRIILWGLVEIELGLVTANMTCMGPLISKITGGEQSGHQGYANGHARIDAHESVEHLNIRRSSIKGFRRMASEEHSLNQRAMEPNSADRDLSFAECIAMDQINVKGKPWKIAFDMLEALRCMTCFLTSTAVKRRNVTPWTWTGVTSDHFDFCTIYVAQLWFT